MRKREKEKKRKKKVPWFSSRSGTEYHRQNSQICRSGSLLPRSVPFPTFTLSYVMHATAIQCPSCCIKRKEKRPTPSTFGGSTLADTHTHIHTHVYIYIPTALYCTYRKERLFRHQLTNLVCYCRFHSLLRAYFSPP